MGSTYLYRHFGADGALLYVGVSLSAVQRLAQHREHAHWFAQIKRVEVEQFATRDEALAAERGAIVRERPLFNIQYSERQQRATIEARARRVRKAQPVQQVTKHDRSGVEDAFWQWRAKRRNWG